MKESCPTAKKIINGIQYLGGDEISIKTISEYKDENLEWKKLGYDIEMNKYVYNEPQNKIAKGLKYLFLYSAKWRKVLNEVSSDKYDIIQTITPDYIPVLASKYSKKPIFHHFREIMSIFPFQLFSDGLNPLSIRLKRAMLTKMEKLALERCFLYSSDSKIWLEILQKRIRITKEKLIIKNAPLSIMIPKEKKEKLSRTDNRIRIVHHGHINISTIKFIRQTCERGVELHLYPIIKDENVKEEINQMRKYENFIVHPNIIGYKNFIYEISQYDYGLIPPPDRDLGLYFESYLPCKLYDYLAAGLPVIAGRSYKQISKFIKDEDVGYLIDDVDDLIKILKIGEAKKAKPITADDDIRKLISKYKEYA